MALKTIRLELARETVYPSGDPYHGYEFRAPLTAEGHLDAASWARAKPFCTVHRFTPESEQRGLLIKKGNDQWAFSYDDRGQGNGPVFRFSAHRFVPGEYITITEHDDVQRTYKVVSVGDTHIT